MPPRPLGLNAGVAHAECGVGCLHRFTMWGFYLAFMGCSVRAISMSAKKKRHCCRLKSVLTMFLYVVETQRKDFDDYLKEDFRPVFFFVFSFHCQS